MDRRISKLLEAFPENDILMTIQKTLARIMSMSIYTRPLKSFVTGLHILIQNCDQWQTYASRQYSISEELENLR